MPNFLDKALRHEIRMNKINRRVANRNVPLGYIERDGVLYAPGEYVEPRPRRDYITRYHNTDYNSIGNILDNGIVALHAAGASRHGAVFTSTNDHDWSNFRRPVQLELRIPKEWHVEHAAYDERDGSSIQNHVKPYGRILPNGIDRGERSYEGGNMTLYDEDIDPRYIRRVCFEPYSDDKKICFDYDLARQYTTSFKDPFKLQDQLELSRQAMKKLEEQ